eukprot:Plantae.Rhodophyta-Hildenbrandia_rubra.ctg1631.p1 GENE.Plantae.Rhodophyta-Hildenbrandia_rubra.ctg1631~~Plantae.Rhodophyta-Hildenbrandia_rubra.ctg1631.p1  ORF type:complete len:421 (-),score=25.15 Plantae.Rhodophyta-Hildenbrandia_rubra.ctg1631:290-1468(-)
MLAAPFSRNVNHGFLYICVVFAFYRFLRSPTMPVLDAYTLEYLVLRGTAASKMKYGKYRLWGAVSWGVISVAIGLCLDHYGFSSMYAFSAITTTFLLVLCARERWHGGKAMETHFVPFSREEEVMSAAEATQSASIGYSEEEEETEFTDGDSGSLLGSFEGLGADCERQESVLGFCRVLLTNPRSIAFLFTVASSRVGTSLVENLVFLFFAQELRASYFLCGVAVAITVVFEIPLFYVSETMLSNFSSASLLLMGMFCYITRVIVYTLVDSKHVHHVLWVEPLHGVTYSLIKMATVQEMSELSPPHLQATGQSFLSVFSTLGTLIGVLGGSFVMQAYGSVIAYRGSAVLVTVAALVYGTTVYYERQKEFSRPTRKKITQDFETESTVLKTSR